MLNQLLSHYFFSAFRWREPKLTDLESQQPCVQVYNTENISDLLNSL